MHEAETPAMATGGGAERNVITILWYIENLSCFQREFHGNSFYSPHFYPHTQGYKGIQLLLIPRGEGKARKNVYLRLYTVSPFSEDCEFSFLAWDGSPLVTRKGRYCDSRMGVYYEMTDCLTEEELFLTKKSTFLPHDTLTVRCRVWNPEENFPNAEFISGRTRIEFAGDYILRPIGGTIEFNLSQSKTFPLELDFIHGRVRFDLNCSLTSDSQQKPELNIEVSANRILKELLAKLEVSVLDNGREIKLGRDECVFIVAKTAQSWEVSKFVLSENLIEKMSLLRCYEGLCLFFHFTAVGKDLSHCIERKCLETPNPEEDGSRPSSTILEASSKTSEQNFVTPADLQRRNNCLSTLGEDLFTLYQNQTFSDFELRSGDVCFPVHKNILCARSPVFSSMFSSKMEESNSKSLDVPDLDAHALNRMLTFMYGGTVEPDLPLESAAKLYYAADKYQVDTLKSLCSSILQSQICVPNVSDILTLADRHQDSDLTSFVHNFILMHFDDVMDSEEWEKFLEVNPALAGKSAHLLYKEKRERKKKAPKE